MKPYYTSRSLLVTFLPLLVFFLLYKGFVYLYLRQHEFWAEQDWGYLVLLIATLARVGRLCKVELSTSADAINYLRLLHWRAVAYDALCGVLGPGVLLPVVGFVVVAQTEYLLMLFSYCSIAVGISLFLELRWAKHFVN
ncbi:hypothetical protein [Hymenobacter properus]|uniref:Uncharacterized protein n=1 Tax=Hymenobacter properus TaxID=2791026 RepID=A0A931FIK3_9BACT|nr:hypothetical protein [Hymenobacter properus]MBF9142107.1 hypothetical protein [Hymenobacter properus]MBR7720914.1 hypothetical protein [Microvirga sp. SRT04]